MKDELPVSLLSAQDGDVLVVRMKRPSQVEAARAIQPLKDWFAAHDKDVFVIVADDESDVALAQGDIAAQIREFVPVVLR